MSSIKFEIDMLTLVIKKVSLLGIIFRLVWQYNENGQIKKTYQLVFEDKYDSTSVLCCISNNW